MHCTRASSTGWTCPSDDLFQIFTLHETGELVFSRTFPEADRDDIIYIQVLASYGYTPELKQQMYASMVDNMAAIGIRQDTLLVSIVEIDGAYELALAGRTPSSGLSPASGRASGRVRCSPYDERRHEFEPVHGRARLLTQPDHELRRLLRHLLEGLPDRREGRPRPAGEREVVVADDRELIRDADPSARAASYAPSALMSLVAKIAVGRSGRTAAGGRAPGSPPSTNSCDDDEAVVDREVRRAHRRAESVDPRLGGHAGRPARRSRPILVCPSSIRWRAAAIPPDQFVEPIEGTSGEGSPAGSTITKGTLRARSSNLSLGGMSEATRMTPAGWRCDTALAQPGATPCRTRLSTTATVRSCSLATRTAPRTSSMAHSPSSDS